MWEEGRLSLEIYLLKLQRHLCPDVRPGTPTLLEGPVLMSEECWQAPSPNIMLELHLPKMIHSALMC